MVLLIDANVILDYLLDRDSFADDADVILKLCEKKQVKGYVSTLSFANIAYIVRKFVSHGKISDLYTTMSKIYEFADFSSEILEKAARMGWKDLEDAIQAATAEKVHADFIITRNVKDFRESKVRALTPKEFLHSREYLSMELH